MDRITEYLLSITAASIICVAVKHIVGPKGAVGNMISVAAGIFMLLTVLNPLVQISAGELTDYLDSFGHPADAVSSAAAEDANEKMKEIIKQQSEAYIMDKVKQMSLNLTVEVNLSDTNPPVPISATIAGTVSPYNKRSLSQYISDNLGILQENLEWC